MGFYPVTPASDVYVLGNPIFEEVKLQLPNNKEFIIKNTEKTKGNIFVKDIFVNGKKWESYELPYKIFTENGRLDFLRD